MAGNKKNTNTENDISYKDNFLSIMKDYGDIEKQRTYDIEIQGKNRKYPHIITENSKLDLVETLKKQTGYSFFFAETGRFYSSIPANATWKKDIEYNEEELNDKGFLISLLHEVGHFPIDHNKKGVKDEQDARIKALHIAKTLKNTYNVCFLAGFTDHNDVYNYTKKRIDKYKK